MLYSVFTVTPGQPTVNVPAVIPPAPTDPSAPPAAKGGIGAILLGAGAGFLVGGPPGAIVGAIGAGVLGGGKKK